MIISLSSRHLTRATSSLKYLLFALSYFYLTVKLTIPKKADSMCGEEHKELVAVASLQRINRSCQESSEIVSSVYGHNNGCSGEAVNILLCYILVVVAIGVTCGIAALWNLIYPSI